MKPLQVLTPTEQVSLHLEAEILSGNLSGKMPGMKTLSQILGINHKTADGAVKILEAKGLVRSHGSGQKRSITPAGAVSRKALKVNILLSDPDDAMHHCMINIRDQLIRTGHLANFAPKSLSELKMDPMRIQKLIAKHPADAWIVQAASREVLQWLSQQPFPAFGLFGRIRNIPIAGAGTAKEPAILKAVSELYELGHRLIVMLVREEQCMPHPGPIPRAFLEALTAHGIQAGRYNLPHWQMSSDSFRNCLDSLFQHTPPTALFISEAPLFIAAQQHLAYKGIVAPNQVSMVCHDPSAAFHFCSPAISHIGYDLNPCIRRVLQWVKHVAADKPDHRQALSKSVFVRGGTIAPPPCRTSS